jgi:uridine kinase
MPHENERRASSMVGHERIVARIQGLQRGRPDPLLVALDGGSGSGKSTLAAAIVQHLDVALIPLDDFYRADIGDQEWERFTVEEKLKNVFDWDRLREEVIQSLLAGRPARWQAFDFAAGRRPDGTYELEREWRERAPAPVILLEGAYSAGPELVELVDLAILVDSPVAERHARLKRREAPDFLDKWHEQ